MFHRNLLGVLDPPLHFRSVLRTESGTTCADPRSGAWFGRVAEQSSLTDCAGQAPDAVSGHTPSENGEAKVPQTVDRQERRNLRKRMGKMNFYKPLRCYTLNLGCLVLSFPTT